MEQLLLTADQVAEVLAIGRSKTYSLLADGTLPSMRIRGSIRVPIESLRAWIAQRTVGGGSTQSGALSCGSSEVA